MATGTLIENYPGVGPVTGWELSERMHEQIHAAGVDITYGTADGIRKTDEGFAVSYSGEEQSTRTVIIANGARRRRLLCPGEAEFVGKGVSYCAICDGSLHRGRNVAVVGGGKSAVSEALYLSGICRRVYLIHRGEQLRDGEAAESVLSSYDNITLFLGSAVSEICGDRYVRSVKISGKDGESEPEVDGVFVSIGCEPQNEVFRNIVNLTDDGYIRTFGGCRTSEHGIFAAGDTREGAFRQIISAAADGAAAAAGVVNCLRDPGSQQEI